MVCLEEVNSYETVARGPEEDWALATGRPPQLVQQLTDIDCPADVHCGMEVVSATPVADCDLMEFLQHPTSTEINGVAKTLAFK